MNEVIARRLRVHGRVQGVGFRFYTVREALARNLTGWVRNRTDGTVEIQAQGRAAEIDDFLLWVHRGPDSARVDRLDVTDAGIEALTGFCEIETR
ncbi:acylphosphatase [Jeongeupia naejangsanensis]|uniref:Acylphosphatase n=1 Tax=Jeongeupia naejangsanensis TaxID=613195 RepID=A0ABS2BIL5_9NEIS|nr:acylphosphatase [Jeongeupia naejangsanensis]MBM3115453.1 acylphosphatase [Jeongeupia naejangsanensis]